MTAGGRLRRADGRELIDVKLHGTAIYVDAARLYALAHGVAATGTPTPIGGIELVERHT